MGRKSSRSKKAVMRRCGLDRAEWDFSNVERSVAPLVCMREYSRECLRELEDEAALKKHVAALGTTPVNAPIKGDQLQGLVRAGLQKRANIVNAQYRTEPILKQVDLAYLRRTLVTPTGPLDVAGDIATFRIDWRADDAALQKAFSEWLKTQRTNIVRSPWWLSKVRALILHSITGHADLRLVDYTDASDGIRSFLASTTAAIPEYRKGSSPNGIKFIEALRTLAGKKVGRGDSKLSLLTDLGIYRLHRAGATAEDMKALLGKDQLKFYDTPLIRRAIKKARDHIHRTLEAAIICEVFVVVVRENARTHTPTRRGSRRKL